MREYPPTGEKYLNSIRNQYSRIKGLEDEKKEYWVSIHAMRSPNYETERVDGGLPVGTPEKLIKLEEYGLMIDTEYDELTNLKIEAKTLIRLIPNHDYRTILEEYYLLHRSLRKIASIIYMANTVVQRKFQQAVAEFNDIYPYRRKGSKGSNMAAKT